MPAEEFFRPRGPFLLGDLVEIGDAKLDVAATGSTEICDIAPLDRATATDLSFLDNPKYLESFSATGAGACVVAAKYKDAAPPRTALVISDQPYRTFALIAQAFYPDPTSTGYVHPRAVVDETAMLGTDVQIDPQAVIGANVTVGRRTIIGAGTVIGNHVRLGEDCRIGANVTIECATLGDRVAIQPGVRIGPAGFGFAPSPLRNVAVPQVGGVRVGNDCHIGANCTIARGSGDDTIIGDNVWTDNLVQIAHNVEIGSNCILIAQSGIAGSTRLGNFVIIAAQAGLTGHLNIGDGAQIGAQAGVMRDVPAGARMMGSPAQTARQFWRQTAALQRKLK